jgi:hypothetical protein
MSRFLRIKEDKTPIHIFQKGLARKGRAKNFKVYSADLSPLYAPARRLGYEFL